MLGRNPEILNPSQNSNSKFTFSEHKQRTD